MAPLLLVGNLASGRLFWQAQGERLRGATLNPVNAEGVKIDNVLDSIVDAITAVADDYPEFGADRPPGFNIAYIHLQDAAVVSPGPRIKLGWWRGRLANIDGWTVGGIDFDF